MAHEGKVLIENFWIPPKVPFENPEWNNTKLYESQVGLTPDLADWCGCSNDPESIFWGLTFNMWYNVLFYWLDDGCMYTLDMELHPPELRRLPHKPNSEHLPVVGQFGSGSYPDPCDDGELIFRAKDDTDETRQRLWHDIFIRDVPIGKVLERSVIIEIST